MNNARATYSEIGGMVGLSRVAVKNRIEIMEQGGIIRGYKTIIDPTKVPQGVQFIVNVEAIPELYKEVVDTLGTDEYLRQIYTTSGDCRLHAVGFAPNIKTLESHVNHLFLRTITTNPMNPTRSIYHILVFISSRCTTKFTNIITIFFAFFNSIIKHSL